MILTPNPMSQLAQSDQRTIDLCTMLFGNLKSVHQTIMEHIWHNPDFTPQQMLDMRGSEAVKLFIWSQAVTSLVNLVDPASYDPFIPYEFTINADGTATVGAFIESSSDSSVSSPSSASSESSVSSESLLSPINLVD